MLCMTNFARDRARPGAAGDGPGARPRRRAQVGRHPPLRRIQPRSLRPRLHLLDAALRLPAERLLAGRREHRLGHGLARHACARSSAPGCTRPATARTSSAPTRRSASACASAALEGYRRRPRLDPGVRQPRLLSCARRRRLGWRRARRLLRARRRGRFLATELTRGPWDPGAQHAGPPSALLGRELERLPEAEEFQVGRVTFEILRPVPIGPVARRGPGRAPRPPRAAGRGRARGDGEQVLMRARAWRLRTRRGRAARRR